MRIVQGALRLLLKPSSYLLVLSLGLTVWAKVGALFTLEASERALADLPAVVASDFVVFLGLAALFAAGERVSSWICTTTIVLSVAVAAIAGFNAFYMAVTGGQLSVGALAMGLERTSDAWHIATRDGSIPVLVASGIALILLPMCIRFGLRRWRPDWLHDTRDGRAGLAASGAGVAGVVWLITTVVLGLPSTMAAQELAPNPIVRVYSSWVTEVAKPPEQLVPASDRFAQSWKLVDRDALGALSRGPRPNVLVLVLESTRLDHTELPGAAWESPASTPNLHALAERGTWIEGARAVVPHTTKSLFAMECGRIPAMQPDVAELTLEMRPGCLARTLAAAGYETAFFQSAIGIFENRASLVDLFGYQSFHAWEQIQGEPLGYLASDDRSLGPAFAEWLDARKDERPFYATLLTSATHHPYVLPDDVDLPPGVKRRGMDGVRERYAKLVEIEDALLGAVVAALKKRGLLDETLIVAVGDHGEGLPGDRIRQHDNNFLEEGLAVPLVMAGPGVDARGRLARDVSLVGLAPTILARLGARSALPEVDQRFGVDLLSDSALERPSVFGCYYYNHCLGWVAGGRKICERPPSGERFYLDLQADPEERNPLPLEGDMAENMERLRAMVRSTLVSANAPYPPARTLYGTWRCPERGNCRHPNSPAEFFHERPGENEATPPNDFDTRP